MNSTTIIIVTFNAMSWIDHCLKSCGNYPIIVVDNASTDATFAYIQATYPNVIILPQTENLGFGQGNNVGITYALKQGAEHVFLLNQDAYLQINCLNVLIKKQQEYPQYGVLSPVHLNGKGDALDYNFKNFVKRSKGFLIDSLFLKNNLSPEIVDIDFVNAASWLISKECLKKVGGFNPYFFQYGEDRDFVNRVLFHKCKLGIVSNVYVKHDRNQSDSKKKKEMIDRLLLEIKLFDLNDNFSFDQLIQKHKKAILKSLIKFRFKEFNNCCKLYVYFRQKKTVINHYKNSLKSQKEFLFIELL
ncbi:glycosyltransferase family 2 protein [Gaetbulibacter aquiaggeris]|uniref:Glycosyltransferase family 2 protein n=1 Tax=Gaetbulibacter aquiaggeris TaxID=1735373 RepID=A0ABW7MSV2_9FLAO